MTATLDQRPVQIAPSAVELRGVGKTFGSGPGAVTALRGIDLTVRSGEFVCLLGASGCGKSTLLNLIAGLDRADVGRTVDGCAPRPARRSCSRSRRSSRG